MNGHPMPHADTVGPESLVFETALLVVAPPTASHARGAARRQRSS